MYEAPYINIVPDWMLSGTPAYFEHELGNFKFKGPGIYATATDTLLIVPRDPKRDLWENNLPPDAQYRLYCWNTKIEHTILSTQLVIPRR
jgi:hypothetical protein